MMETHSNPSLSIGSVVRIMPPDMIEGALDGRVVTLKDGMAIVSFCEWPEWFESWSESDLAMDIDGTWTSPKLGQITYTT